MIDRVPSEQFVLSVISDPKFVKRFNSKFVKDRDDVCWPWLGFKTKSGYGRIRHGSSRIYSHRVALAIALNVCPDALMACHKCDNPPCCNPNHLYFGTAKENHDDMRVRRPFSIVNNFKIKASIDAVGLILTRRRMLADELAQQLNLPCRLVLRIIKGEKWKSIEKLFDETRLTDGDLR